MFKFLAQSEPMKDSGDAYLTAKIALVLIAEDTVGVSRMLLKVLRD